MLNFRFLLVLVSAYGAGLPSRMGILSLDCAGNRLVRWDHNNLLFLRQATLFMDTRPHDIVSTSQKLLAQFICSLEL